jgi:hypothetical protein
MRGRLYLGSIGVLALLVALVGWTRTGSEAVSPPSIEGTYRLVSRDLANGTTQRPPDILGLMTYTSEYRNLNVYWTESEGKRLSFSTMGTYVLTEREYSEKGMYRLVFDGTSGELDLSGPSGSTPVMIEGDRIAFQFPLYGEPSAVFTRDGFTATQKGVFVDHWEKVK